MHMLFKVWLLGLRVGLWVIRCFYVDFRFAVSVVCLVIGYQLFTQTTVMFLDLSVFGCCSIF
mgnify:CR=1 FL=1